MASASASSLVGLEFDPRSGLTKTLLTGNVAFLQNARCVEELQGLCRTQNKSSQMIPDLVQVQSCRYKTIVVIKRH